jgi:hypothetical protein
VNNNPSDDNQGIDNESGEPMQIVSKRAYLAPDATFGAQCCKSGGNKDYVPAVDALRVLSGKKGVVNSARETIDFEDPDGRVFSVGMRKGDFMIEGQLVSNGPSRKAVAAVMTYSGWEFDRAVHWLAKNVSPEAARNSAIEYVELLFPRNE